MHNEDPAPSTVDFLRFVFPLTDDARANDFIKFVAVGNGLDWGSKETFHWMTRAELHSLDGRDITALGFSVLGRDVYFTPHGYVRRDTRGKVNKDDAVDLIDVCWVELDDGDIPPETFSPPPSVVVHTSGDPRTGEAHYHLYWLLDKPYPKEMIENVNWRLMWGNGVRKDTSGWDLTQLLRMPGSVSYKREKPFSIKIVGWHPERRYSSEAFVDLPNAPENLKPGAAPPPSEDTLPTRAELEAKYQLPRELIELIDRRKEDRSKALWRAYQIGFHLGLSDVECFALMRGSANDKFTDYRYNGAEGLWKDIRKGFHVAGNPQDAKVLSRIRNIRTAKMPAQEKRRKIADEVWKDLLAHGRVYVDKSRYEAYFFDGQIVTTIDQKGHAWKLLLNLHYDINEAEAEYGPIHEQLYAFAWQHGEDVTVRTLAYWDRERRLLYVYNNAGTIYRLDGETIVGVANGTDGILFRDHGSPWQQTPPPDGVVAATLAEAVLGLPNYVDVTGRHTRSQAIAIARLWLYSVFFAEHMEARPHLVVWGPTDSGKTTILQGIGEILVGEGAKVSTRPADRKEFESVVSNAHHAFFDNCDTPNRWMMDCLAEVATGIQFTRRILYTTNDTITYRVQCHIGLTCREQWFARTDVATRLIVLETEGRAKKLNPTTLYDRIRANRDYLWHEILTDLNKIVAHLGWTYVPHEHSLRMAGFADFSEAACQALGMPSEQLLELIQGNQRESSLTNSPVWINLDLWLRKKDPHTGQLKNNGTRINTVRLHQELRRESDNAGQAAEYDRAVPNPRSLSHKLRELIPDISTKCVVEFYRKDPANEYRFTLRPGIVDETQEAAD